jgi:hypothetical protein
MCREVPWDWSDPRYHRPAALRLIRRPDRQAPPGTTGPTRDLIGAWHKAPSQCCPRSGWCVPPPPHELERDDMASMPQPQRLVTVGVDSHKDVHVAAAVDQLGRILGTTQAPTTRRGYGQLERWAQGLGKVERFGIEGTGSYAAGLARWLAGRGHRVVEVNRPNRQARRRRGKSDPVDAEAAARAVLSQAAQRTPKSRDGKVEMIRALRVAGRSAVKARTQASNQLHDLVVSAPEPVRESLCGLAIETLVRRAAGFRSGAPASTRPGGPGRAARPPRRSAV